MIHICRQGLHNNLNCLISPVSHQSLSLGNFLYQIYYYTINFKSSDHLIEIISFKFSKMENGREGKGEAKGTRNLFPNYLKIPFLFLWAELASTLDVNYTVLDADEETSVLLRYNIRLDGHINYREGVLNGYAFQ